MKTDTSWVTGLRADVLAKVYLTRRSDLEVITTSGSNGRATYDLLVRVKGTGTRMTPEFGVEVKGITEPLESRRWRANVLRNVERFSSPASDQKTDLDLPICLFVFNIDTEEALYMWLKEPVQDTESHSWTLNSVRRNHLEAVGQTNTLSAPFERLDDDALGRIVNQVVQWYQSND